jgi:O-antigen/teichoic acid export membrane protein
MDAEDQAVVSAQGGRNTGFAHLTQESLVYALGSVAGKVIGLLMLPVLTRLLTPSEYGRLDMLSTLGSAAISALLLGLDIAVVRIALDEATTSPDRRRLFGSWAAISLVLTSATAAIVALLAPTISRVLFGDPTLALGVAQVGLVTVFGTYQVMALTILRIQHRPGAFAVVSAATLLVNAFLAVGLLLAWRRDSVAVMVASAASLALGAALGMSLSGWGSLGAPSRSLGSSLLRLGLPLAPAVIATWTAEFLNRAILLDHGGAEQLGFLSVALRFGSIAGLAVAGFQLAWLPRAFAHGTGSAALERIGRDGRRILVAVSSVVVVVAVISPEAVVLLSGHAYMAAIPAVGVSLVVQSGAALYLVGSMPSALARRLGDLGIAGTVGVLCSIAVNLVLASGLGAVGTGVALAVGQIVSAMVVFALGRRHVVLPLLSLSTAAVVGTAAVVAILATWITGPMSTTIRGLGVLVFCAVLLASGTLGDVGAFARRTLRR